MMAKRLAMRKKREKRMRGSCESGRLRRLSETRFSRLGTSGFRFTHVLSLNHSSSLFLSVYVSITIQYVILLYSTKTDLAANGIPSFSHYLRRLLSMSFEECRMFLTEQMVFKSFGIKPRGYRYFKPKDRTQTETRTETHRKETIADEQKELTTRKEKKQKLHPPNTDLE